MRTIKFWLGCTEVLLAILVASLGMFVGAPPLPTVLLAWVGLVVPGLALIKGPPVAWFGQVLVFGALLTAVQLLTSCAL